MRRPVPVYSLFIKTDAKHKKAQKNTQTYKNSQDKP